MTEETTEKGSKKENNTRLMMLNSRIIESKLDVTFLTTVSATNFIMLQNTGNKKAMTIGLGMAILGAIGSIYSGIKVLGLKKKRDRLLKTRRSS